MPFNFYKNCPIYYFERNYLKLWKKQKYRKDLRHKILHHQSKISKTSPNIKLINTITLQNHHYVNNVGCSDAVISEKYTPFYNEFIKHRKG